MLGRAHSDAGALHTAKWIPVVMIRYPRADSMRGRALLMDIFVDPEARTVRQALTLVFDNCYPIYSPVLT